MWEKLKQLARRYDEIGELLEVPEIYADPKKLRALTREQKELSAVVEAYRAYQKCEDDIAQALELVSDPELKDMAQEELNTAKAKKERLFDELRVLLLPRDPNDDKNVIVEIRGGVGGEESALFAADLYRMYAMYAEKRGYRVELLNYNDTELGGVKEADFIVSGDGAYSRFKFESGVHRVQRVPETETGGRIHHENRDIGLIEHEARPAHPFFTERSLIIQSRRVDDNDRTEGEQLHRLADRVGRCTAHLGDYRKLLPGHTVDQTGFACIAQTEKADVYTFGRYFVI